MMELEVRFEKAWEALAADGRSRRVGRVRLLREYDRPLRYQIVSIYDSGEVGEEVEGEGAGS
jgi:hypothetical protein